MDEPWTATCRNAPDAAIPVRRVDHTISTSVSGHVSAAARPSDVSRSRVARLHEAENHFRRGVREIAPRTLRPPARLSTNRSVCCGGEQRSVISRSAYVQACMQPVLA